MRFIFSCLFIAFTSVSFSAEQEILGVTPPPGEKGASILAFYEARKTMNMALMDSLYPRIIKMKGLSIEQKALKSYFLGWYYIYTNLYDLGAKNFKNATELAQECSLTKLELRARMGIATISFYNEDIQSSLDQQNELLILSPDSLWEIKADLHANVAASIQEKVQYMPENTAAIDSLTRESIRHYRKAIRILESNKGEVQLCRIYALYSMALLNREEYEETEEYIRKASEACLDQNNPYAYHFALIKFGILYNETGDHDLANKYLNTAIRYYKRIGNKELQYHAMSCLSNTFEKTAAFDSAYLITKKMTGLKSIIDADKMRRQSNLYRTELEVFDKEKQINKQNKTIELQQLENEILELKRRRWIIGGVSGISLTLLLGLLYVQNIRHRNRKEKQKLLQIQKEESFKAIIQGEEQERKRMAQELHDGMGQQLSAIKMAIEQIENKTDDLHKGKIKAIKTLVDDTAQETRELSHSLMPLSLANNDLTTAIEESLSRIDKTIDININFEHYNVDQAFPNDVENCLYRVFQELMNNVLKHAEAKSVNVQLFKAAEKLVLIVEDDGKGIKPNEFDGKGLSSIKNRLRIFDGELNLEAGYSSGTVAKAYIKLDK